MRLIDADRLIRRWCGMKCGCERDECGREIEPCIVVMAIEEAPTIDIVRCRECKYYNGKYCFNSNVTLPTAPKPDDFCSYGSRSEKPNNCETCKWWEGNTNFCYSKADSDDHACHYEPKDKWREERSSE